MPDAWLAMLGRRLHVQVDGNTLDPRVRFSIRLMHHASGGRGLERFGVKGARAQMQRFPLLMDPPAPKVLRVDETEFDGPRGMVRVRIYQPPGVHGPRPVLVYFHGGGGVVGDLDTHDVPCRTLCCAADCAVVSVEYGLAPETPFPGGFDDCLAAFRWVRDHPDVFGSNGEVAVGGDSMGANLAAAVALEERGETGPCFQLLIYPVTDPAGHTASRDAFGSGFLLDTDTIDWFESTYLRDADPTDPRVAVLRVTDFAQVAPAYLCTAGFDPLRDEGAAYADALKEAGVPVTLRCFRDQVHGFVHMTGAVPSAAAAMGEVGVALGQGFRHA